MNNYSPTNIYRRGNALILVIGILVLLVLVATAFITKTQSGRVTAVAQQDAGEIDDRAHSIFNSTADEIAIALFPRRIANTFEAQNNSANARRVSPDSNSLRYGFDPSYPFNYASYDVIPWTNPPDDTFAGIPPLGPENPIGGPSFGDHRWLRDLEPQRTDTVDFMQQGLPVWNGFEVDGTPETFSHWRHVTNLSRSGNSTRVVRNISDVAGYGLVTDLDVPIEQWPAFRPLNRLGAVMGSNSGTGFPSMDYNGDGIVDEVDGVDHLARFNNWQSLIGWGQAQNDHSLLPQNFLDLSDLDADGNHNEIGERPIDAYTKGTPRWYAELAMTDADGDGFTDSFWHLHPQTLGPDTKQVYAVSVTDNSGRGNMNVATRFFRKDYMGTDSPLNQHGQGTRGHSPADLAIVGQNDRSSQNVMPWRVGFMDSLSNLPDKTIGPSAAFPPWVNYSNIGSVNVDWYTDQWQDRGNSSLLDELGIEVNEYEVNLAVFADPTNGVLNPSEDYTTRYGRLWYWQLAGRDPFSATYGLRPFTLSDELELRIAEGNNYQFVGSRFERSVNDVVGGTPNYQFLRSDYQSRHEASELRDQLDNRQLLFDNRRKLTMFSGVRNDLLSPWLRWEDRFWNRHDPDGLDLPNGYDTFDIYAFQNLGIELFASSFPTKVTFEAFNAFGNGGTPAIEQVVKNWRAQSRSKVDLRSYYSDSSFGAAWWESNTDGYLTLAERAPLQLLLAMTDSQESGISNLNVVNVNDTANARVANMTTGTYRGPDAAGDWDDIETNYYQQARLGAAGFASNLLSYRDEDDEWRMHSTLSLRPEGTVGRSQIPLSGVIEPPVIGRQANLLTAFADTSVPGPNESSVRLLGMEAQPFILETFIGHVHQGKIPGNQGACCLDTGGCQDVSEETCVALLGGLFFPGEVCDPNGDGDLEDSPCPDQGGCCLPSGGCIYTSQSSCDSFQGTYLGDTVSCSQTSCQGACCFDNGECQDLSAYSCGQIGAVYAGNGSDCSESPCAVIGACCLDSGTCLDVISSNSCTDLGGSYIAGEFCLGTPCLGPCCVDFADCFELSSSGCTEIGGAFFGEGDDCTILTCVSAGACCVGNDNCAEVLSIEECNTLDGEFLGGTVCADAPCVGSCCTGEGVCQDISLGSCILLGGEYIQGATCNISPCRSSCCFSTGGCSDLLQSTCEALNGIYQGGGMFCDENSCQPTGACCLPDDPDDELDGGCLEVMQGGCNMLGGSYQGDSVACGSVPCGSDFIRGACCLETGQCQNVVSQEICDSLGGVYQGELISCASTPCTPSDACCIDDVTCMEVIQENCDALGGEFHAGELCADTPCQSACCLLDGSCADLTETDCDLTGGTFFDERTCDTDPCVDTGACCVSDTACDIVSETICDSLGGDFQGENTSCNSDPCGFGEEGACCLEPYGCVMVLQTSCTQSSGVWDGSGTCDINACEQGACCLDNGESAHCLDVVNSSSCDMLGGTYSNGDSCLTRPCIGACCLWGGGCELISENSCDNLWDPDGDGVHGENHPPGNFNGVGTNCNATVCDVGGSCCLASDTCIDIQALQSFRDYCQNILGGTYRPAEFCAETPCGGACCLTDGSCENLPESTCDSLGGIYQGAGIFCSDDPCGEAGSCCYDSGSCMEIPESACVLLGGEYTPSQLCDPDGTPGSGDEPCIQYFLITEDIEDCPQETVAVVQLANPYDREIDLDQYAVEFFGQDLKLEGLGLVLPPSTPANPATLILYAMPETSTILDPEGTHDFVLEWLDYLDIEAADHPVNTVIYAVPNTIWNTKREYYDDLSRGEQQSVALYRFDSATNFATQRVLIDRLDRPTDMDMFDGRIVDDLETEWSKISSNGYVVVTDSNGDRIEAEADQSALFVMWDRATRAWAVDVPEQNGWHNDQIDAWEQNPRYVFAAKDFIRSEELRTVTNAETSPTNQDMRYTSAFHWTDFLDPDDKDGDGSPDTLDDDDLLPDLPDPWFTVEVWSPRAGGLRPVDPAPSPGEVTGGLRIRKPTYFDMNHTEDAYFATGEWSYPDKGWYGQREDEDDDDTTSDTPAFADDVLIDDIIGDDEVDIAMTFPLQMLQKDDDFEQVGELLNVWMFGHMLEGSYSFEADDPAFTLPVSPLDSGGGGSTSSVIDAGTITTFSEFMYPRWDTVKDWWTPWVTVIEDDEIILDARVNRLRYVPDGDDALPMMMDGRSMFDVNTTTYNAINHAWPRLSIASRILDSFVCDGPGRPDITGDGIGDDLVQGVAGASSPELHSFYNANGFTGKATPGMININTAPIEVLRMLPHMFKVVHQTHEDDVSNLDSVDRNPRSLIPEAIVQWRELGNGSPFSETGTGFAGGPNYQDRSLSLGLTYGAGPKNTRGFSSPSEIGVLRTAASVDDVVEPWNVIDKHQSIRDMNAWRIDFAAGEPFGDHDSTGNSNWIDIGVGTHISTDLNHNLYYGENTISGDGVSGDAEELNLLQAGISNLITTTSDMFTVHLRIRTFKRNPISGIWDATDAQQIIDDSRYVMLVDRSNVNTPADKPRILYYEKLPN